MRRRMSRVLGAVMLIAMAAAAAAQEPSVTTTTQTGKPMSTTSTRYISGKIVSAYGNKVVVEGNEGAREYTVPDGFKFQMGGKDLGVADLEPGMSVSATVTTTTTSTPVTVTQIRKGKVLAVSGQNVIVRGPSGIRRFHQQDFDKRHVTLLNAEGKEIQVHQLKAGDVFTAVIVTDEPPVVVSEREAQAILSAESAAAPQAAPLPAAAPPPTEAPQAAAPQAEAPQAAAPEAEAPMAAAPVTEPAPAEAPAKATSPFLWVLVALILVVLIALILARRKRRSN